MATKTKSTAEAEALPTTAQDINEANAAAAEAAEPHTDSAPPVGAALFGTPEQAEKHVAKELEKQEALKVDTEKLPVSAVEGEVHASVYVEGAATPVLVVTPVGWTGTPQVRFAAYQIDDVIKALQELRKAL